MIARAPRSIVSLLSVFAALAAPRLAAAATPCNEPVVPVAVTYDHPSSLDEDDMCYWVHPTNPALSTVIVTDKFAGQIFVYDLAGTPLQVLPSPSPRNVDTRYNVPFDGSCIDVVAFTDRTEDIIRVYRVDRATRGLVRIDDGAIHTQDNYGFTLFQQADGRLLGLTGDRDTGLMRQFALFENGLGRMSGYETSWTFHETRIEGVVADDETGYYYLGEESVGIWRVGALDHTDRTLIARVGDATGLVGDIEGLALYHAAGGQGYLIASSQGDNKFTVIDREPPHLGRGSFRVQGVRATDGIDVLNTSLNGTFSKGIFSAHNGGSNCCSVASVRWEDIANALNLAVDTDSWSPRVPCRPLENSVVFEGSESGASLGARNVTTDHAVTAAAGDLYLASVGIRGESISVQSVAGLGLSWTRLAAQCSGRGLSSIETWTARGFPSGDSPVTASLTGTPSSAVIAVSRYANVASAAIGSIVSANTKGRSGSCSGGTDGASYALDVQTSVAGAFVYGAATMRHREHSTTESYRERVERHVGTMGGVASAAVVDRLVTAPGTIPLRGTFSSSTDWAAIGFEIRPAATQFAEYGTGPMHLSGSGVPHSGGAFSLELTGARPSQAGALLVSLSSASTNLPGGLVLYLGTPFLLRAPLSFDALGNASLPTSVPPGLPAFDAYVQGFAVGATTRHSNGLRVSILP